MIFWFLFVRKTIISDQNALNSLNDRFGKKFVMIIKNNALSEEYIYKYLNYLTELLPQELIYYNPINTQWKSVLNKLEYSLLVVDPD